MTEEEKEMIRVWARNNVYQTAEQTVYLRQCTSYLRILTWGLVVIPWGAFVIWLFCVSVWRSG